MKVDWRIVARDALIVLLILWVGNYALAAVMGDTTGTAAGLAKVVVMAVGFCISGCLFKAREGRVKHIALVALVAWGISFINLFTSPGRNILEWVFSAWPIAVGAAVGGGLSMVLVKGEDGGSATQTSASGGD
jgi:hypothetical protein